MDAIINGLTTFFQLVAHSFQSLVFFFTQIPEWFTQIAATFQLSPSFLLTFLSVSLSLTVLVGILKWLPF